MPFVDKEAQLAYQREWSRKRYASRKMLTDELKASGCIRCGENDVACLSFHHRNPEEKSFSIANMPNWGNAEMHIKAEAAKCIVLCENCHRKLHAGRFTLDSMHYTMRQSPSG